MYLFILKIENPCFAEKFESISHGTYIQIPVVVLQLLLWRHLKFNFNDLITIKTKLY